jgi:hypothetical protein
VEREREQKKEGEMKGRKRSRR